MKGKIIVIDGMDGTGKETQSKLLYDYLKVKYDKVYMSSFPNYESDSSFFVKKFLNGEYKNISNPYLISLFYSIDRGITYITELKEKYDQGYIIILDRYYISNVIYQLHNFDSYMDKMLYIQFLGIVEVEGLKLPIPDITILLYSHPSVSNELLNKRYDNDNTKRDIFENVNMQSNVYNNIEFIAKYNELDILEKTIGKISTIPIHDIEGKIYTREQINANIIEEVKASIK